VEKINAWTGEENSKPKYPHLIAYEVGNQYSGRYDCDIEKVHMLRLKQLTLGYNLHQQFAQKIGLTSARIFLTAENLFLLTNYSGLDPEIVDITKGIDNSGAYPLPRKFSVGLTVNF
jgi:putative outer membrane protein